MTNISNVISFLINGDPVPLPKIKGEITETELIEQLSITGLYRSKANMNHRNGIQTEAGSLWFRHPKVDTIQLVDKDRPVLINYSEELFKKIV